MLLLQFSTSHYCRKARLALGYKKVGYEVENLTPGFHILKLKPLTGLTTVPALQPTPEPTIGDSTRILHYLESHYPQPSYTLSNPEQNRYAWLLEDWLDESIGTATRFVYYDWRSKEGKSINPSLSSQLVINIVRRQYGITPASVKLAKERLQNAIEVLSTWQEKPFLVGESFSVADLAAAALLSPLALIPEYRQEYPWLFQRIAETHQTCNEPLPPGLDSTSHPTA